MNASVAFSWFLEFIQKMYQNMHLCVCRYPSDTREEIYNKGYWKDQCYQTWEEDPESYLTNQSKYQEEYFFREDFFLVDLRIQFPLQSLHLYQLHLAAVSILSCACLVFSYFSCLHMLIIFQEDICPRLLPSPFDGYLKTQLSPCSSRRSFSESPSLEEIPVSFHSPCVFLILLSH